FSFGAGYETMKWMRGRWLRWMVLGSMALGGVVSGAGAQQLPPGGTVRALAADPLHPGAVLLGTATGVLFRSQDAGRHWRFFSRIAAHDDWVVAGLVPDRSRPGHWFAALWSWSSPDGGVFASSDGGASWQPLLLHHAVRALAQAPSAPATLVAATLDGVYRSQDAGADWQLISPARDRELQNIESVAIDPGNADEIYVGTWHLPWKTVNGGHDWWQMRQGVIDDSDVFSIAVDQQHPATVYLSACSGIYRSDDRGNLFRKIQGIPYTARRTPALVQDAADPATVYAGTTQGLWITRDQGASWMRVTSAALRINAVVELPGRLLLGTDFAGVYAAELRPAASGTRGAAGPAPATLQFVPANRGFASHHVAAMASSPAGRYLAITGDDAWGGIFFQPRGAAAAWTQLPPLPEAGQASGLHWSPRGLLAATGRGVYRLETTTATGKAARWQLAPGSSGVIHGLAGGSPGPAGGALAVVAAADDGLLTSSDGGLHWTRQRAAPAPLYLALRVAPWLFVAGPGYVLRSPDGGRHFLPGRLSLDTSGAPARIQALAAAPTAAGGRLILAATSRGLYQSSDWGAHWSLGGHGLPAADLRAIEVRPDGIYVLAAAVGAVYRSSDQGQHWQAVSLAPELETELREAPMLAPAWPPPEEAATAGKAEEPRMPI
ncbi:MAG: WD40/YVTN/BNR-like repeat-containing protein, partial [Terriglobales bacterium]